MSVKPPSNGRLFFWLHPVSQKRLPRESTTGSAQPWVRGARYQSYKKPKEITYFQYFNKEKAPADWIWFVANNPGLRLPQHLQAKTSCANRAALRTCFRGFATFLVRTVLNKSTGQKASMDRGAYDPFFGFARRVGLACVGSLGQGCLGYCPRISLRTSP